MNIERALLHLQNAAGAARPFAFDAHALESEIAFAFTGLHPGTGYEGQRLLAQIYRLHTTVGALAAAPLEDDPHIEHVRILLERHFLRALDNAVESLMPEEIPQDDFADWLELFIGSHEVARHPTYFAFLAHEASIDDIRFYLVQESAIDGNTDDFLAALQIGAPRQAKLEIAANYWDEMGEGSEEGLHSELFLSALRSFAVGPDETTAALTFEALVCGNLQTMLSLRRKYFYLGIGYFAATEQLVPERFKALKLGWERTGLPESAAQYHMLHIEVDSFHTERWYREVIRSVAAQGAAQRAEIVRGALHRIFTSQRYLDSLMAAFPSRQSPARH
jgi:hypothetical protein